MIQESIVVTQDAQKSVHIAPMGIHVVPEGLLILPFKPSTTLSNLIATGSATINYTDDVRIFAGCLTGRRDWPVSPCSHIQGHYLENALAHDEVELIRIEEDTLRPKLLCKIIHRGNHAPFLGFNRAQYAVLEAAILVSRLTMLSKEKIDAELKYLAIGYQKAAGEREQQAWEWLMTEITLFRQKTTEELKK